MADKRESGRIKDNEQRRVLDAAARRRRQRKALEALEQDNYQDDPHADLKMSKKAPKFEESMETSSQPSNRKKKKYKSDHFKYRFKKSFSALMEEEHMSNREPPNYVSACAPPAILPPRHFCAVCGFLIYIYVCTVRRQVLQYQMSGNSSGHKVFEMDIMKKTQDILYGWEI